MGLARLASAEGSAELAGLHALHAGREVLALLLARVEGWAGLGVAGAGQQEAQVLLPAVAAECRGLAGAAAQAEQAAGACSSAVDAARAAVGVDALRRLQDLAAVGRTAGLQ